MTKTTRQALSTARGRTGETAMAIVYEWDVETTDEHGDIVDHRHSFECPGVPTSEMETLVLVRSRTDAEGDLEDRKWAYVVNGRLPEEFESGNKVPGRFHRELDARKDRR